MIYSYLRLPRPEAIKDMLVMQNRDTTVLFKKIIKIFYELENIKLDLRKSAHKEFYDSLQQFFRKIDDSYLFQPTSQFLVDGRITSRYPGDRRKIEWRIEYIFFRSEKSKITIISSKGSNLNQSYEFSSRIEGLLKLKKILIRKGVFGVKHSNKFWKKFYEGRRGCDPPEIFAVGYK